MKKILKNRKNKKYTAGACSRRFFIIILIVQNKVKKYKKRAVVSDCSFFVNMLNMVFEH